MSDFTESRTVVLPREPLFEMLLDIERYPEFVPGYRSARILERGPDWLRVNQEVGVGPICQRFDSMARFSRPQWIRIQAEQGPFRQMSTHWWLEALEPRRTRVGLRVAYEAGSLAGAVLARSLLGQARRHMLQAFLRRATEIAV